MDSAVKNYNKFHINTVKLKQLMKHHQLKIDDVAQLLFVSVDSVKAWLSKKDSRRFRAMPDECIVFLKKQITRKNVLDELVPQCTELALGSLAKEEFLSEFRNFIEKFISKQYNYDYVIIDTPPDYPPLSIAEIKS